MRKLLDARKKDHHLQGREDEVRRCAGAFLRLIC
jgi:hypothetical protein